MIRQNIKLWKMSNCPPLGQAIYWANIFLPFLPSKEPTQSTFSVKRQSCYTSRPKCGNSHIIQKKEKKFASLDQQGNVGSFYHHLTISMLLDKILQDRQILKTMKSLVNRNFARQTEFKLGRFVNGEGEC